MAVTNYTTLGGVIVHENRGGTQRNYVPDTLGSTAKMTDSTSVTDTFEYWPYGESRSHTGSNVTPFTFVGTLGYCKVTSSVMTYVRARMYHAARGRWATVDPLWPFQQAYAYGAGHPTTIVDPSGKWIWILVVIVVIVIIVVGVRGCHKHKPPTIRPCDKAIESCNLACNELNQSDPSFQADCLTCCEETSFPGEGGSDYCASLCNQDKMYCDC